MIALDQGTATVLVALITGLFGLLTANLVQSRKMYRKVEQVNNAVNNVPEGVPTLIQRVEQLERRQDATTRWLINALQMFGRQLGINVPAPPNDKDEAA